MRELKVHPLRLARIQQDLTQEELADATRLGLSTIRRAEQGFPINAKSRRLLCAYFGKNSQELGLFERGWKQAVEAKEAQPAEMYSSPSPRTPLVIQSQMKTSSARFTSTEAIDLLSEMPDLSMGQHPGAWLALSANHLSHLFEAGWSLESILEALRVVLQSTQDLPQISRRKLLQLGAAAITSGIALPDEKHISEEEKLQVTEALGKSIGEGWKLFSTGDNLQVLAVAQALLHRLQEVYTLIEVKKRAELFSSIYNLLGIGLHHEGLHSQALNAHNTGYLLALSSGNPWHIAQSLVCQVNILQFQKQYREAMQAIEEAWRITQYQSDEMYIRTKAHILGCWVDNALAQHSSTLAVEKLEAIETYLDHIPLNEEFDQASWLLLAGKYARMNEDYITAIQFFEQAQATLPTHWLIRQLLIVLPQIEAYAYLGKCDAALECTNQAFALIRRLNAPNMGKPFLICLHGLLEAFPHDNSVEAFVTEMQNQLPKRLLLA